MQNLGDKTMNCWMLEILYTGVKTKEPKNL